MGWKRRINSLAVMALVIYCIVLSFIPLSNLHIEGFLLSDSKLLADRIYRETDFMILVHEILFAYLCNSTEHLSSPADQISGHHIGQTGDKIPFDILALKPYLMSLTLLAFVFNAARRYSFKRGKALPQTVFCYRLFYHSPPFLDSL